MPRTSRSATLDSPTKRRGLPSGAYHQEPLPAGGYLRYRCPALDRSGTWFVQDRDPETGKLSQARLAEADDWRSGDGREVMNYQQAREAAEARIKAVAEARRVQAAAPLVPTPPTTYTVAVAWVDYLADAKARGVKGVKIYEQVAKAQILPVLGPVEVDRLTKQQIKDWHLGVSVAPRHTGKKVKPGETPQDPKVLTQDEARARRDTANRVLSILKACLNYALDSNKVHGGAPWRLVKPFAGTSASRVRILTADEQIKLLAACDEEFRSLVQAGLFTGARYGELSRVEVRDFNGTTLHIKWGKSKGAYKARHCFLTSEAKDWFRQLVSGRAESELMFRHKDVVRTTRTHLKDLEGWGAYDQVHAMSKACKAAGIKGIGFHQLRHTAATKLLVSGVAATYVSKQLGHSDGRMVSRHYGHLTDVDMEKAMSGVDKARENPVRGSDLSQILDEAVTGPVLTDQQVEAKMERIRAQAPTLGISGPGKV